MKFAIAVLAVVALCHVQGAPTVSTSLLRKLKAKGVADIVVQLSSVKPVVDSINARRFVNSGVKTTTMVSELRAFTQASQQQILAFLSRSKSAEQVKSFWITNRIIVKAVDMILVQDLLKAFPEIAEIREAKVIHLEEAKPVPAPAPKVLEWGVDNINADLLWPEGIDGTGVVVSSIDTGVRATHVSLRDNKRATHYWYDPTSANAPEPADSEGHGTHTMGTIAGKDGTGVAPGSEWIHCRAFEGGQATEEALVACGQWIVCPTNADGTEEDCTKKPGVCSNSWGGGNEDAFYNDIIAAWQAADIVPVFAIGNSGPGCRTANSPGDQPNLISVGATNAQNLIASFSSHGPSQIALRIKPEVSAPGQNVRSASNLGDQFYAYLSGTSMACPHVAGAVALLKQKNPAATFEQIRNALEETAYRPQMPEIGWGKIDVNAAAGSV